MAVMGWPSLIGVKMSWYKEVPVAKTPADAADLLWLDLDFSSRGKARHGRLAGQANRTGASLGELASRDLSNRCALQVSRPAGESPLQQPRYSVIRTL